MNQLHPKVKRMVKVFYILTILMWLAQMVTAITGPHALWLFFVVVYYTQVAMVLYGSINGIIQRRRKRKEDTAAWLAYQQYLVAVQDELDKQRIVRRRMELAKAYMDYQLTTQQLMTQMNYLNRLGKSG